MAKQVINSLQVFRGFAALAVVCHHATVSTEAFVGKIPAIAAHFLNLGYLGVDFFFVLSGFIIMYAHMNDERTLCSIYNYGYKRISRIFPAYIPISIALLLLYQALPSISESGGRNISIISSLFLLPANAPPALPVAWTLIHELIFYAVFITYFVSPRVFMISLVLWGGVILATNSSVLLEGWSRYPLSVLNIEFMFGIISAWCVKHLDGKLNHVWVTLLGITFSLLTVACSTSEMGIWLRLPFAFGLALIIVGFGLREQNAPLNWPPLLMLIGNASYSLYLVHNPLLSMTQRIMGKLGISWFISLLSGVLISLVIGIAYYHLVEKKSSEYFRRQIRSM